MLLGVGGWNHQVPMPTLAEWHHPTAQDKSAWVHNLLTYSQCQTVIFDMEVPAATMTAYIASSHNTFHSSWLVGSCHCWVKLVNEFNLLASTYICTMCVHTLCGCGFNGLWKILANGFIKQLWTSEIIKQLWTSRTEEINFKNLITT